MIDFEIPEETRLLVDTVRRFVETEIQPHEEEMDAREGLPPEVLADLKAKAIQLGLFAMNMPAEVGGGGLSAVEMCLVEEQLGKTTEALVRNIFGQVYEMLTACRGPAARGVPLSVGPRGANLRFRNHGTGGGLGRGQHPHHPRSGTGTTTCSTVPSTSSATATSPISRSSWR